MKVCGSYREHTMRRRRKNLSMIPLPDPRFARKFEIYSLRYWEIVARIMDETGADQDVAETFVQKQNACIWEKE